MTMRSAFRSVLALAAAVVLLQPGAALAASGSITNVHDVAGGKVEATYTTNMDICDGSYCGWYPHAWQLPATQACSVDKSHLTYVGDVRTTSGSQTGTDSFYPAYAGAIRICLYAAQAGAEHLIADTVFTPAGTITPPPTGTTTGSVSGSITAVRATSGSRYTATYTTTSTLCTSSNYCGWYAHAWQLPASEPCSEDKSHLTYVGDSHDGAGTETTTDDFYPAFTGRTRLCLYLRQGGVEHLVAETTFTPRSTTSSGLAPSSGARTFTLARAQRAVRSALTRRLGSAFTRGTGYRRSCSRRSSVRFRCSVSWRRGADRYRGTVTVWVHTPRSTHFHYSIRLVRTRPLR